MVSKPFLRGFGGEGGVEGGACFGVFLGSRRGGGGGGEGSKQGGVKMAIFGSFYPRDLFLDPETYTPKSSV